MRRLVASRRGSDASTASSTPSSQPGTPELPPREGLGTLDAPTPRAFGDLPGARSFKRAPDSTLAVPRWIEMDADGAGADQRGIGRSAELVMLSATLSGSAAGGAGVAAVSTFALEASVTDHRALRVDRP